MQNSRKGHSVDPLAPNKALGQNFLNNPRIIERIITAAQVGVGDTILEIGPGKGALTQALVSAGARVIAIEKDARMAQYLLMQSALAGAEIIAGDIMDMFGEVSAQMPPYKIVANIPYNITSHLLTIVLTSPHAPLLTTLMVQKEIADRICRPVKQSLLSLSVACYATPHYEFTVSRGNFVPMPKVDSAVMTLRKGGYFDALRTRGHIVDEMRFFALLKRGFSGRRKQLGGLMRAEFPQLASESAWLDMGIPPTARAEDVSLDDWWRMYCLVYRQ